MGHGCDEQLRRSVGLVCYADGVVGWVSYSGRFSLGKEEMMRCVKGSRVLCSHIEKRAVIFVET